MSSDEVALEAYLGRTYAPGAVSLASRDLAKRALTTSCIPIERRRARRLVERGSELRLHLGAADTYLDGWCNIDYARPGRRLDLRWDLRRPLPFPDASVDAIFSEHVFEHIPYVGALRLLRECRRLLRRDGVCRIGVPDFERYARSYLGADPLIDDHRPDAPTRALAVAEVFYLHGHRSSYDFETLSAMATAAGFSLIERSHAGGGRIVPSPDSPARAVETLYVDAVT